MPTETNVSVTIKEPDPITYECSFCRGPVQSRRPSQTGRHYCSKPGCQAAKQRFYRSERTRTGHKNAADREAEKAEIARRQAEARDDTFVAIIRALAHQERVACPECKRTDALPNYIHPDPETGAPCRELRELPLPSGAGDKIVAAIWP